MSDQLARFERVARVPRQGGQGDSYKALDVETGEIVFVKELKRSRVTNEVARKRFRREVVAYETVQEVKGIPRLVYDNSERWTDRGVQLFLALEWVEGLSLAKRVHEQGPLDTAGGIGCVTALADALAACHKADVTHRDIKPDNVMLRDGDALWPVLVDFGLSFNHAELDDVTQVEEIGNRFLRLPEHAAEGNARNHASDVTLLAGVLLYCLTGHAPRVLQDEAGRMPHQRPHQRQALAAAVSRAQMTRLNRLFDHAFDTRLELRIQTARELGQAVRDVADARPADEDITAQFNALISDRGHVRAAELAARLQQFLTSTQSIISDFARASTLTTVQSGWIVAPTETPPNAEIGMSLSTRANSGSTPAVTRFRFEQRGAEIVLSIEGEDVWRGTEPSDEALGAALRDAAMHTYVREQQP